MHGGLVPRLVSALDMLAVELRMVVFRVLVWCAWMRGAPRTPKKEEKTLSPLPG